MPKHHTKERPAAASIAGNAVPVDPERNEAEEDARSLDLVQRLIMSALAIVVGGGISSILAYYTATRPVDLDQASRIGLWVMSGVTGALTTVVVLVINRRHAYSPFLVLGLVPMAIAAVWVLA